MKDQQVTIGRWWRWSRYEIREGCIGPAPDARLQTYDPWRQWQRTRPPARSSNQQESHETPYQSLLRLLAELRSRRDPQEPTLGCEPQATGLMLAPLSAEIEAKLLAWCARYGLLGLLPHRALQVTLSPQAGLQLQYIKIGAGWTVAERSVKRYGTLAPGALLQPLRGTGLAAESLVETWSCFFPAVAPDQRETFPYPQPLSPDFWVQYAEPLTDFLAGLQVLQELHDAIRLFQASSSRQRRLGELQAALAGGPHLLAEGLTAGARLALGWSHGRKLQLKLVGDSLVASLALMMLQDLSYGRALQCPRCGRAFVSGAYQARYCSQNCRWVVQKRAARKASVRA